MSDISTTPKCRHRSSKREHVSSCVQRCTDCGMLYAMIAGRSSISRRWVEPTDPRVQVGETLTKIIVGERT